MKILSNINKFTKIIFVNLIILLIFLFILDFIACFITVKKENLRLKKKQSFNQIYFSKFYYKSFKKNEDKIYVYNKKYRPVENISSKKKPILIFGCSYAYGYNLKDNETFSYQLGKLTGRPVYNRAYPGRSIQHMLYQLQSENFYKIIPKPEYIIYILVPNNISRLYMNTNISASKYNSTLLYKVSNNSLKRDKLNEYLSNSSLLYCIKRKIHSKDLRRKLTQNEKILLKLHFTTAYNEAKNHWGNDVKFVIILYPKKKTIDSIYNHLENELKISDFIILNINNISSKNFISRKYKFKDEHPNAKAWEEITPLIVKELNL